MPLEASEPAVTIYTFIGDDAVSCELSDGSSRSSEGKESKGQTEDTAGKRPHTDYYAIDTRYDTNLPDSLKSPPSGGGECRDDGELEDMYVFADDISTTGTPQLFD